MNSKQRSLGKIIQDIFSSILLALFIAVIIRIFFISAFFIPSSSMEKVLKPGDQILVWKFLYNKHIPVLNISLFFGIPVKRQNIIVFKIEGDEDDYIKRIIGLPGDKILLKNNQVYVNGILLKEPYINTEHSIHYLNSVFEVPVNKVFVLGDNRSNSRDSREFGFVSIEKIVGKIFFIFYPFNRIRFF